MDPDESHTEIIRGLWALEPRRQKSRVRWVLFFLAVAIAGVLVFDGSIREVVFSKVASTLARISPPPSEASAAPAVETPAADAPATPEATPAAEPAATTAAEDAPVTWPAVTVPTATATDEASASVAEDPVPAKAKPVPRRRAQSKKRGGT